VGVSSTARTLANGSNNSVGSRVEGIILGRHARVQGTDDLVHARGLGNDKLSHIKGIASIAGINLNDNLSNTGGVGDLVDQSEGELGSLAASSGGNGERANLSLGVVVVGAKSNFEANPERIRVSTAQIS
jgi:hypothetical protein